MNKYYIEILHPYEKKVLWHYFADAVSEEVAKEAASQKFIAEQSDGMLLDTGGLFLVTAVEEKLQKVSVDIQGYLYEFDVVGSGADFTNAGILINDIMTRSQMIGVDFDDIRRMLDNRQSKFVTGELALPLDDIAINFKTQNCVYAVYGDFKEVDMHSFELIQNKIGSVSELCTGGIIDEKLERKIAFKALIN